MRGLSIGVVRKCERHTHRMFSKALAWFHILEHRLSIQCSSVKNTAIQRKAGQAGPESLGKGLRGVRSD